MGTFATEDPEIDDVYFLDDGIFLKPTDEPTVKHTINPSKQPTKLPTLPTDVPSQSPSRSISPPTNEPTVKHTINPSKQPTKLPTLPTDVPSQSPSRFTSPRPTVRPTTQPSKQQSSVPSLVLSFKPSPSPSFRPSTSPSLQSSIEPSLASSLEPSTQPSVNTGTKTYLSCAAPAPKILEGIDNDGNTVLIRLEQPVSTVPVGFTYEVTTKDNSSSTNLVEYLPGMQSELGDLLAGYLKSQSHTENEEQGETSCEGYYVHTLFRRLQDADQGGGTKIIAIASSSSFAIDSDKTCTTSNSSCSVVEGSYDVTYVGTDEAAVRGTIIKAMMEEVRQIESNSFETEVSFLQEEDHNVLPPVIQIVSNDFMDSIPESEGFGSNLTIYGKLILGLLGAGFMMIVFVVFRHDGKGKEKKVDDDDDDNDDKSDLKESSDSGGSGSGSGMTSYDLENVVIDDDSDKQPIDLEDGSKSQGRATTPRVSNKARCDGDLSQTFRLVDRTPSRIRSISHRHKSAISMSDNVDSDSKSELPSILEVGLPPPSHDTPARERKTGYFSSELSVEIIEMDLQSEVSI